MAERIIYRGVNLMLPTYHRSETRLPEFVESVESTIADPANVVYTFMCHGDDYRTILYLKKRIPETRLCLLGENERQPHLAKFWNRMYRETKFTDPAYMVSMVGDDMQFQTQDWSLMLLDECNAKNGLGLWFGDDCKNTHELLTVNIFTTRKVVDALAPLPFMCEMFPCDDMDTVWDHTTRRLGILYYLNELKLFHNHATLKPDNMDEVWARLRSVFAEVERSRPKSSLYVQQCVDSIWRVHGEEIRQRHSTEKVCAVSFGRYGDIILASFFVNQLVELGYSVEWTTLQAYVDLVKLVSPGVVVKVYAVDQPDATWSDVEMAEIEQAFSGAKHCINIQPGSSDHHDKLIRSGISTADYMQEYIEKVMAIHLDRKLMKYAAKINTPRVEIPNRSSRPLCVIAPETISINPIWSDSQIADMVSLYSKDYDVRVLSRTIPQKTTIPANKYLRGHTFVECFSILKQCDLFIGQDSGLAWVALFSKCRKEIHHRRSRVTEVNNRFSVFDPNAVDIIEEGL